MKNNAYLKQELLRYFTGANKEIQDLKKFPSHKTIYDLIRLKRFLLETLMIFVFQFLIITNLKLTEQVALPMHPPIGIAFSMFYLVGNSSFFGLVLAGFLGYFLKEIDPFIALCYFIADIAGGYLGARLCRNVLSSDLQPFANWKECLEFIKINAFITCLLSSGLRILPFILSSKNHPLLDLSFNFIDLWLADLNAILIITGFLFSWSFVSFSRARISSLKITFAAVIGLIFFIAFAMILMPYKASIFLILLAMITSLYLSLLYGYLIATALLFILSGLYLSYFITHLQAFLSLGLWPYTLVPATLLAFTLAVLYLGHLRVRPPSC